MHYYLSLYSIFIFTLLNFYCCALPVLHVNQDKQKNGLLSVVFNEQSTMKTLTKNKNNQFHDLNVSSALYHDGHNQEQRDLTQTNLLSRRLAFNLFHGIPRFGRHILVSAFSGIPRFG